MICYIFSNVSNLLKTIKSNIYVYALLSLRLSLIFSNFKRDLIKKIVSYPAY